MDLDAAMWSGLPFEIVEQVLEFVLVPGSCRCPVCARPGNGLFAAVHAHNASLRETSFMVMRHQRWSEDPKPPRKVIHGWCILNLSSRRWYRTYCNNARRSFDIHGIVAMDRGLVCQYLETEPQVNSIIVHNPIGCRAKEPPTDLPILASAENGDDSISRNFKIFLIIHNFGIRASSGASDDERLKIRIDHLVHVYNSATNERQGSTNPSCVTWYGEFVEFGNAKKVEFQGLLCVIVRSIPPAEEPLWPYNLVEDAWENLPVRIHFNLRKPELIASTNRLFLAGWLLKHIKQGKHRIHFGESWYFQVSEIRIPKMTRETLVELSTSKMLKRFDIKTGFEDSDNEYPRISVIGLGDSHIYVEFIWDVDGV